MVKSRLLWLALILMFCCPPAHAGAVKTVTKKVVQVLTLPVKALGHGFYVLAIAYLQAGAPNTNVYLGLLSSGRRKP